MIYEILIRGNSKGEIVGGHVIRFGKEGLIGVAEEIPKVGKDLEFDGILPKQLQDAVALANLERDYESAQAQIESLTAQIADLQSQLQGASQQVVSQEEILKRLEALEAKQ